MSPEELREGQSIQVIKSFTDFDGLEIEAGTKLTFLTYSYFPYDDGYTFKFNEMDFRLAGISSKNQHVLSNFSTYFQLMDR